MPSRLMDHLERYLKHARFDGPVPVDEPPPVECPRCHEACGWCGDYRHMHGMLKMLPILH